MVRKVDSGACAGFVGEGLVPAHWWVELSLVPLVDRAMSRSMSRGSCGLRKSLGSLSSDGWGCVPTLLVVLPEASYYWTLQVVGWGQVLVLMTQARCLPPQNSCRSTLQNLHNQLDIFLS